MHLLVFNHIGQGQIGLALACVSLKGISFGRNPQRSCGGRRILLRKQRMPVSTDCMQRGNTNFQENSFVPEN